jgi:hypothetical protein
MTERSGHGRHPIIDFNGWKLALQADNHAEYPRRPIDDINVMALRVNFHEDAWRVRPVYQFRKNLIKPPELN